MASSGSVGELVDPAVPSYRPLSLGPWMISRAFASGSSSSHVLVPRSVSSLSVKTYLMSITLSESDSFVSEGITSAAEYFSQVPHSFCIAVRYFGWNFGLMFRHASSRPLARLMCSPADLASTASSFGSMSMSNRSAVFSSACDVRDAMNASAVFRRGRFSGGVSWSSPAPAAGSGLAGCRKIAVSW